MPRAKTITPKVAKEKKRSNDTFYPLSKIPEGYFRLPRSPGAITSNEQALTLSGVFAATRLFQTQLGSLPLPVYKRDANGGRTKAREHPAYRILHDRPNPAQSRSVFWEYTVKELLGDAGNSYTLIRKTNAGDLLGLFPIPSGAVTRVWIDDEWNKFYEVQTASGTEIYDDTEVLHLFGFSLDGVQGISLLRYAAESLGLHRQVLEASNAFYTNSARPSCYVRYPGKLDKNTLDSFKAGFKENFQGTANAGGVPVLDSNGEVTPLNNNTAEDAQIVEALGLSVSDIARWFGLSPSDLGDREGSKYASLAADNAAFYQRSLRTLISKIEQELNHKLFGDDDQFYAEFLLDGILRGDPAQQQTIFNGYVQSGIMTRSECREMLNLPPIEGLDVPMTPVNQAVVTGAEDAQPIEPKEIDGTV